jgi:hypothetical protein
MHGKTKSLLEDISISIFIVTSIFGLYYLYSSYNTEEIIEQSYVVTNDTKPEIIVKSNVQVTNSIQIDLNKTIIINEDITIKKEIPEKIQKIIEEKKIEVVTVTKTNIKTNKNVDLKLLRTFLIDTQYKIRKNIVYPTDINNTMADKTLNLKVTILKNGNYEQLVFVNGNKELFEMNKNNILEIFPLKIDKKIIDDFPRYVRIKIK